MVTSVLHDQLKRSVNILPSACRFGPVLHGQEVEMTVNVQNEDSLSQRIHLKPLADSRVVVKQESYGAIAPGMHRKLIVTIKATAPDSLGKIKEELHIVTKSDVYKLPIEAEILNAQAYEQKKQELLKQGGTQSRIRTRLRSSIAQGRQQRAQEALKQSAIAEEKLEATEQRGSDDADEKKDGLDQKETGSNGE